MGNFLLNKFPQISSYTFGDISKPRLEQLKANFHDPRVKILELDCENIPENMNEKFDAVVMIALIEHLIDPITALQNVYRVLKPGGYVFLDTPNIAKYTQRIKLLCGRFPSTASSNEGLTKFDGTAVDLFDEGHLHYFTFNSLCTMLTHFCGFDRTKLCPYPGGRRVLGGIVHTLLANKYPRMFSELGVIAYK